MSSYDLIVRGGVVVQADGRRAADVGIKDGKIVAVGPCSGDAVETFDARGLFVLPGAIDTQVHFREPGFEHKEDLETGTRAALLGGMTGVFEMPNTKPATTTVDLFEQKLARMQGRAWVNYAFYVGATPDNADVLAVLENRPGCAGTKIFMGSSTGNLLVAEDAAVERILRKGKRRVAVHCEDEERLKSRKAVVPPGGAPTWHPIWRDVECALGATRRLVRLARKTGRRVHVLHVTTREEIAFLRSQKDIASVETSPQHLTLFAPECYERLGTYAQMNPPIRDVSHREGLWEGIRDGTVDVIGSDHAPHTREEKDAGYPNTPSGMPGVQTYLMVLLDHVNAGRLTLERVVDLSSYGAARIFGLRGKGRVDVGYDADLTLVDLGAEFTVTNAWIASRCGWTPYDGMTFKGRATASVIGGKIALRDGAIVGAPKGAPFVFEGQN